MLISLIVALWERTGFSGRKRTLVTNTYDLQDIFFNDTTLAIGVHPGPNYRATDTVSFFEDSDFGGRELVLRAGTLADLSHVPGVGAQGSVIFDFGKTISSVRFNGPDGRAPGLYIHEGHRTIETPIILGPPAATIAPISVVVDLYRNVIGNFDWSRQVPVANQENAQHLTLVEPTTSLPRDFGDEWNDNTQALVVTKGPNYRAGDLVRLYDDVQPDGARPGSGSEFGGWHDFAPGSYLDLAANNFSPITSAVGIVPGCATSLVEKVIDAARLVFGELALQPEASPAPSQMTGLPTNGGHGGKTPAVLSESRPSGSSAPSSRAGSRRPRTH